jgi:hypothetical protein
MTLRCSGSWCRISYWGRDPSAKLPLDVTSVAARPGHAKRRIPGRDLLQGCLVKRLQELVSHFEYLPIIVREDVSLQLLVVLIEEY